MLLHVSGSLAAIGKTVGASAQSILCWRNGTRNPHPSARAQMQVALGIPVEAWTKHPITREEQAAAAAGSEDQAPLGTMDECLELLAVIRKDRSTPNLLPGERSKLIDAEARILKLRADLEQRAELSEDRYVREHPAWLRVRNEISRVLAQHPAAARAVAEALERLGL